MERRTLRITTTLQRVAILFAFGAVAHSTSFGIETLRGIVGQSESPVCANHCDQYYLLPDSGVLYVYLKGSLITSGYVNQHVEVTGYRAPCGGCFSFYVSDIKLIPTTGVEDGTPLLPLALELGQNFPNPFNPVTHIPLTVPQQGFASLKIYDVLGEERAIVLEEELSSGRFLLPWNAEGLPSGIYYCHLRFRQPQGMLTSVWKKMLYLK